MRGLLATVIAAAGILGAVPDVGEAAGSGLGLRSAKVRLHRIRGAERDRMKVIGAIPMLEGDFDPRRDPVDFLVAGTEVLCEPGGFPWEPEPDPSPNPDYPTPVEPPDYGRPVPGIPGTAARDWTLQERNDGTWIFRTAGRRLDLNLVRGTIVVRGRNLDLGALPEAGPEGVDIAFVLGGESFGTVIDFEQRGRTWRFGGR